MRFMIIVHIEEGRLARDPRQLFEQMGAFHVELARAGAMLDAAALQPSSEGWRVQYYGPQPSIVDGPFTQSKDLVAAYTLIEVRTRDEGIEWSRRISSAVGEDLGCCIEVRPLYEPVDIVL